MRELLHLLETAREADETPVTWGELRRLVAEAEEREYRIEREAEGW